MSALVLSVLMLATAALTWGGVRELRRGVKRGWLMLAAAVVMLGNVLIQAL